MYTYIYIERERETEIGGGIYIGRQIGQFKMLKLDNFGYEEFIYNAQCIKLKYNLYHVHINGINFCQEKKKYLYLTYD